MEEANMRDDSQLDVNTSPKNLLDKGELDARKTYLFCKRIVDILGSFIGLIVLSPVFLYVAFKIKQEDPSGPVFFSQNRVGKNGQIFKMYKFRSMCVDAEQKLNDLLKHNEIEGAMFKMKDDPRVTKIGKFIRKTSIDELPQFWNVLKGDMSLVGPRPPLTREVNDYTEYDKQRLYVKPGCTGLWQISGRNHVGFTEMVEMDISYIQKSSMLFDLKVIFRTILVIIKPNGAY